MVSFKHRPLYPRERVRAAQWMRRLEEPRIGLYVMAMRNILAENRVQLVASHFSSHSVEFNEKMFLKIKGRLYSMNTCFLSVQNLCFLVPYVKS
jgi:hypothetical protein